MVARIEEMKARREAGRKRELEEMSVAKRVQREILGHRPPASELKTPHEALTAAKTLHREIRTRIEDETHGTRPRVADYFGVAVGYVTPDLSTLGFTPIFAPVYEDSHSLNPSEEERIEQERIKRFLSGNVALGLIFGIADDEEMVMGARPFIATKQTDAWLKELMIALRSEFENDKVERR